VIPSAVAVSVTPGRSLRRHPVGAKLEIFALLVRHVVELPPPPGEGLHVVDLGAY
jgi:hypothetical protein